MVRVSVLGLTLGLMSAVGLRVKGSVIHHHHARYGQPHLPHFALRCEIVLSKQFLLNDAIRRIINCSDVICRQLCHVIYNA
jgi:hypothetical protein